MKAGLLLFAHGARDARWAVPFEEVAEAVRGARPGQPVRLAFLELMAPDIRVAALDLIDAGCDRIDVLPLFLGAGGHVRKDLPALLDDLRSQHAGVEFRLHPAIGEAPSLIAAMADIALNLPTTP
ncbi:MAG: CbiX/SirB N-terminal domain-containing protein [Pseudomonadota bacterium]